VAIQLSWPADDHRGSSTLNESARRRTRTRRKCG
jgi:hypothetical protein